MDVTKYLEVKPAPAIVFEHLPERASRPRFMLPNGDDWRAVTWQAFADQIRDVALYLRTELSPGDRAAIFAPNRVEWMAAALGIQTAGAAMVPIYGSSTAEQAAYVVEHSDAKVVFVDGEPMLRAVLQGFAGYRSVKRVVLLDGGLDAQRVADDLRADGQSVPSAEEIDRKFIGWPRVRALGAARHREQPAALQQLLGALSLDQTAVMLYTSGTSGRPKGVPLTHQNVGTNGRDWLEVNAPLVEEGMVDLLWLPMSHIFGFGEAGIGNQLGWVTYMSSPQRVMDDLPRVRPSVFMSVPSVWDKFASAALATGDNSESQGKKLAELTGGNLKFCLSGGAGLKREVKELFYRHGTLIVEGYGLTECSPTLTLNRLDAFRFDSVGKPLPSVELKLAADGEILARGPNIFGGYHKNAEATQEAFEDGWFKTGDIGRFTDDGFLQIVDRKKDILVTAGGKNVAPANIEMRFNDDPYLAHLVVYGDGHKYLVAGIWLNDETVQQYLRRQQAGPEAIESLVQSRIDLVNAELARFETIKKFLVFDEPLTVEGGMLTPTLKVKRKAVYAHYGERLKSLYAANRDVPNREPANRAGA